MIDEVLRIINNGRNSNTRRDLAAAIKRAEAAEKGLVEVKRKLEGAKARAKKAEALVRAMAKRLENKTCECGPRECALGWVPYTCCGARANRLLIEKAEAMR
jgi:hypothetical protein